MAIVKLTPSCKDYLWGGSRLRTDFGVQSSLDPLADGVVLCHAEGHRRGIASNHADVMHWWKKFGVDMDDFRAAVAAKLRGGEHDLTEQQVRAIVREELAVAPVQLGDLLQALKTAVPVDHPASPSAHADEPDEDDLDDALDSFGC